MRAEVKEADKETVSCCDERPRDEGPPRLARESLDEHEHVDDGAHQEDSESVHLHDFGVQCHDRAPLFHKLVVVLRYRCPFRCSFRCLQRFVTETKGRNQLR